MDAFAYVSGDYYCESVPVARIAEETGTPVYVYSKAKILSQCREFKNAFSDYPTTICYAVKANGNLSVLRLIFGEELGADVVSGGELERAFTAGASPNRVVFSGVGKTRKEIQRALKLDILSLNVESLFELQLIEQIACELKKKARVALRINPNIDAKTSPYITTGLHQNKFGISEDDVERAAHQISESDHIALSGIACHIGSQITDLEPFQKAGEKLASLSESLRSQGHPIETLDLGGGLGVSYQGESIPGLTAYAKTIIGAVSPTQLKLIIEPGRSIVAESGVLLTEVLGIKRTPVKQFVVVDAASNDLFRPLLYNAYHDILPVREASESFALIADVVGPICESTDFLGKNRRFPALKTGDLLLVRNCGAYASSMASNYNSRTRAPEVIVDGNSFQVVRRRERLESLWEPET